MFSKEISWIRFRFCNTFAGRNHTAQLFVMLLTKFHSLCAPTDLTSCGSDFVVCWFFFYPRRDLNKPNDQYRLSSLENSTKQCICDGRVRFFYLFAVAVQTTVGLFPPLTINWNRFLTENELTCQMLWVQRNVWAVPECVIGIVFESTTPAYFIEITNLILIRDFFCVHAHVREVLCDLHT